MHNVLNLISFFFGGKGNFRKFRKNHHWRVKWFSFQFIRHLQHFLVSKSQKLTEKVYLYKLLTLCNILFMFILFFPRNIYSSAILIGLLLVLVCALSGCNENISPALCNVLLPIISLNMVHTYILHYTTSSGIFKFQLNVS